MFLWRNKKKISGYNSYLELWQQRTLYRMVESEYMILPQDNASSYLKLCCCGYLPTVDIHKSSRAGNDGNLTYKRIRHDEFRFNDASSNVSHLCQTIQTSINGCDTNGSPVLLIKVCDKMK